MFNVFLVVIVAAAIFCLYIVVACLLAASRENDLPDMEDIMSGERISSDLRSY